MKDQEERLPGEPSFCLHDFKRWMEQNAADTFNLKKEHRSLVGTEVEPRVSIKRIAHRMDPDGGDVVEMAKAFKRDGGTIKEVDGSLFMIEVSCGTFILPRGCVKRKEG